MSYETYHIPVNFTDAGKLFGVFERSEEHTSELQSP